MNENIKRMMFLFEYNSNKNRKKIQENIDNLFESKQTENNAIAILKQKNIDERSIKDILYKFKEFDKSKNQILLPVMATIYNEIGDSDPHHMEKIKNIINSVVGLINQNKIRTIQSTKEKPYEVNGKSFNNFLRFSEYVHTLEGDDAVKTYKAQIATQVHTDEKPLFENDKVLIYDGNDVGKCIKYGSGDLTGRAYNFCIGNPSPSANQWQNYRDSQGSTFYYVVDKTREMDDPLHIVVVDHTANGFLLTDANNSTGNIAEFGSNSDAYLRYLKSLGVNTDIFENIPQSDEERARNKKLGTKNPDLEWFKALEYDEQLNYIGRGHQLSDEQFNYLWRYYDSSERAFSLLLRYVDTGVALPKEQFEILVGDE